ncbi:MAG: DUF4129 domain-containing protein [Chloroflexota bacterium]
MLMAANLSQMELHPGEPFPYSFLRVLFAESESASSEEIPSGATELLIDILMAATFVLLFLVLIIWIITYILRPEARRRLLRRAITYFLWFTLFFIVMNMLQGYLENAELEADTGFGIAGLLDNLPDSEEELTPPSFITNPPLWVNLIITVTTLALILGLVWYTWRRLQPEATPPLELLMYEIEKAVEDIKAGHDLKDTVTRCYQTMHEILGDQRGIQRQQAMTPREFETHLVTLGLKSEHIQRLTRLFERVRYSANEANADDEAEAIDCLNAIAQNYGSTL